MFLTFKNKLGKFELIKRSIFCIFTYADALLSQVHVCSQAPDTKFLVSKRLLPDLQSDEIFYVHRFTKTV